MKRKERNQLWWIPLIVSVVTGIVYLIIYLLTGSIPVIDKLVLFKNAGDAFWGLPAEYTLPFSISRAWDILFIFIYTFLLARIIQYVKESESKDTEDMLIGLVVSLVFGLGVGLGVSLGVGLGVGLVLGFVVNLVVSLAFGLVADLAFSLAFSLGVGLVFGLGVGLGVGLVFGLKHLFSKDFRKRTIKWLARE